MSVRCFSKLMMFVSASSLVTGCSSGPEKIVPPKTVPVQGSVMRKGNPVRGARVKFHPQFDIGKVKFLPYGETGFDGKFLLNTGAVGNGAPKGDYIVTVEMPVTDSDAYGMETEVDQLKGAYSDPAKSDWKVTLVDGENVLEPFQLK